MSTRYVWDVYDVLSSAVEVSRETVTQARASLTTSFFGFSNSYTMKDGVFSLTNPIEYKNLELNDPKAIEGYRYAAVCNSSGKYEMPLYDRVSSDIYWSLERMHYGISTGPIYDFLNTSTNGSFLAITLKEELGPGNKKGSISSNSSTAYPNDGKGTTTATNGNWYKLKGSDSIDPVSVTLSKETPEQGKPVTAIVTPRSNTLGGTVYYLYQYSTDGGVTWSTAASNITATELEINVPEKSEQFMVRVRASDNIGFTSADYVLSNNSTVQTVRAWIGVDGQARKVKNIWVGVDGKAKKVINGWVGADGNAKRFF